MIIPSAILEIIGYKEEQPVRPVVFMRAGHTKDSRVRRVEPNGGSAYLIKCFMENPNDAPQGARRLFRQAIVLRTMGGKLRHYPLWLLFSSDEIREQNALKHNQLVPDLFWVRRKRKEVCKYLKVKPKTNLLEQLDTRAK